MPFEIRTNQQQKFIFNFFLKNTYYKTLAKKEEQILQIISINNFSYFLFDLLNVRFPFIKVN